MRLNRYVRELTPYTVVSHNVWQQAVFDQVLKLDWNEATKPPSPKVIDATKNFLEHNPLNWYPNLVNEPLLEAIANYCQVDKSNVQYFPSSDSLHENILRTYLECEDLVAIVSPTYDNFRATAESMGGTIHYEFLDSLYNYDIEAMLQNLSKIRPKILYICSPNNPTGTLWEVEDIKRICNELPDTLVLVDEAYYEFSQVSSIPLLSTHSNLIISRTFSKAFGLASFRVGFAVASPKVLENLNRVRNPKNTTAISQVVALAALQDIGYTQSYVKEVSEAHTWMLQKLASFPLKVLSHPNANFITFKLTNNKHQALCSFLTNQQIYIRYLDNKNINLDCLRITIGTLQQMKRFINALAIFFGVYEK